MLREIYAFAENPSHQASRLVVRAGLLVAAMGLAWTLLGAGVVFGVSGLYHALLPSLGRAGALALSGGIAAVVGLLILLLYGRRSAANEASGEKSAGNVAAAVPEMLNDMVAGYPLESIAAALAAGLLASSVDLTQIVQQIAPALRSLAPEPQRKN